MRELQHQRVLSVSTSARRLYCSAILYGSSAELACLYDISTVEYQINDKNCRNLAFWLVISDFKIYLFLWKNKSFWHQSTGQPKIFSILFCWMKITQYNSFQKFVFVGSNIKRDMFLLHISKHLYFLEICSAAYLKRPRGVAACHLSKMFIR